MEKLRLTIFFDEPTDIKMLLFHILSHLPRLKHLEFRSMMATTFSFTTMEFSTFLMNTGHLETLILQFYRNCYLQRLMELTGRTFDEQVPVLTLDDQCLSEVPLLPATKYVALKKLQLTYVDKRISFEILTRCCTALRSLLLKPALVDNEMMEKIISTHVSY